MSAQYTKKYPKIERIFTNEMSPLVMGILNITNDSFYDGGMFLDEKKYLLQAEKLLADGADIIDVGAQSTRPGALEIDIKLEADRLSRAVLSIRKQFPDVIVSADTYRVIVAEQAIDAGADIINDISGGGLDKEMYKIISRANIPYILTHIQGSPPNMQQEPIYNDVVNDVKRFFEVKLQELSNMGATRIIIDPGFGFGKTIQHNYTLFNHLDEFALKSTPLMVGISRKSMVWKLLGNSPREALNGTTALHTIALLKGASILRVHDVKEAVEVVRIVGATMNGL